MLNKNIVQSQIYEQKRQTEVENEEKENKI